MSIFQEAGIFSLLSLGVFVVGLIVCVRARSRALSFGTAFAAAIGGLSMLGAGLGQRLVDRFVGDVPELVERVAALSAGTREAQANMVIAGSMIVLLMLISSGVSALSPKGE